MTDTTTETETINGIAIVTEYDGPRFVRVVMVFPFVVSPRSERLLKSCMFAREADGSFVSRHHTGIAASFDLASRITPEN